MEDRLAAERNREPRGFPVENWNRYRCEAFLGEGGTGSVYKAFDPRLNRFVALKFIAERDAHAAESILKEARAQARVDHERIAKVFEVGRAGAYLYIAMQWIDGARLDEACRNMSLEEKLALMREVAEAVHAAHRTGLVHRDLKPGNILVRHTDEGGWEPYVIDFGLARPSTAEGSTRTGTMVGTPRYMAPEQVRGEIRDLDRRTDVYALGVTLYEMLTGNSPFTGESVSAVLVEILGKDPVPPRKIRPVIPRDVEIMILKCLEKEPGRRYGSARALSEDLGRYLDGDPIDARPASLAYRLKKKARKHRSLVWVAAVALLGVLASAAWGTHQWLRSAERARIARDFGERSKEIETLVRHVKMLPIHDIREERKRIRDRLSQLESLTESQGDLAKGPGFYALGRGFLALDQPQRALAYLRSAWDDAGYREPGLAFALGRAYGTLYLNGLRQTEQIRNQDQRAALERELETQYRRPALSFLNLSAESEAGDYVEALIAFYEKRYEEALEKTRSTLARMPWFFEARLLEGEIYLGLASDFRDAGEYTEAAKSFQLAQNALVAAAEVGRSDPEIYRGFGDLGLAWMKLARLDSKTESIEAFNLGIRGCERALDIDPDSADVYRLMATLHTYLGEEAAAKGLDPVESWREAVAMANRAIALDPDLAMAHNGRGMALLSLGRHQWSKGEDPREALKQSLEAHRQAVRMAPNLFEAHNNLGLGYLYLARYGMARGEEHPELLADAERAFGEAIAAHPEATSPYINLGVTYRVWANDRLERGRDPRPLLAKAIENYRNALDHNPNHMAIHYSLGNVHQTHAEYELVRGGHDRTHLDAALECFRRAAELQPGSHAIQNALGVARVNLARQATLHGQDPSPFFQKALPFFTKASELNPKDVLAPYNRQYAEWLWAEHELERGADPSEHVRAGREAGELALKLHPTFTEVLSCLGDLHLTAGFYAVETGREPEPAFANAQSFFDQALAVNPDYSWAHYGLGRLHTARALAGQEPERHFAKAEQSFTTARALNPNAVEFTRADGERLLYQARDLLEKGKAAAEPIREGLARIEASLAVNPVDARAKAIEGCLYRLKAQTAIERGMRTQWAEKAKLSLEGAFAIKPYLKVRFGIEPELADIQPKPDLP